MHGFFYPLLSIPRPPAASAHARFDNKKKEFIIIGREKRHKGKGKALKKVTTREQCVIDIRRKGYSLVLEALFSSSKPF